MKAQMHDPISNALLDELPHGRDENLVAIFDNGDLAR